MNDRPLTVRFPPQTLQELRAVAKAHKRSFNGEVIWALQDYLRRETAGAAGVDNDNDDGTHVQERKGL